MNTMDVSMRLGDAIDPCHLANGFEAVICYECQERSNPPFSHPHDTYNTYTLTWMGTIFYVDDAVLIARSPKELQRMLNVCQQ